MNVLWIKDMPSMFGTAFLPMSHLPALTPHPFNRTAGNNGGSGACLGPPISQGLEWGFRV